MIITVLLIVNMKLFGRLKNDKHRQQIEKEIQEGKEGQRTQNNTSQQGGGVDETEDRNIRLQALLFAFLFLH